jgi:hypothetical protein
LLLLPCWGAWTPSFPLYDIQKGKLGHGRSQAFLFCSFRHALLRVEVTQNVKSRASVSRVHPLHQDTREHCVRTSAHLHRVARSELVPELLDPLCDQRPMRHAPSGNALGSGAARSVAWWVGQAVGAHQGVAPFDYEPGELFLPIRQSGVCYHHHLSLSCKFPT